MEPGVNIIMRTHPDVYRIEEVSLHGAVNAFSNMGHLSTNVQAIDIEDVQGHRHAYRPMRQPTHLWEEIDFEGTKDRANRPHQNVRSHGFRRWN